MDPICSHLLAASALTREAHELAKNKPVPGTYEVDLELVALTDTAVGAIEDALEQANGENEGVDVLEGRPSDA